MVAALPRVVHVTTAHRADDVRIFSKECLSLARSQKYEVFLAASGDFPAGTGVNHIPLRHGPRTRVARFAAGPRSAVALSRTLSVDLWHFHDPELLPVALKLAARGNRVIWDAHEDYLSQFTPQGGKSWVPSFVRPAVRLGMATLLTAMDKKAVAVVAATETIASRYENPNTVVVGNEARSEEFDQCKPDFASRRILYTGSVDRTQMFMEVVEAVCGIGQVTLAVAGPDPDAGLWEAAKSRLGARLTHLGWLDRVRLAEAINSSSLGLATYAPLPTYLRADNSPTKLFEFAAAGLPVVGTPLPVLFAAHSAGGCGYLAGGFDVANLRAAIVSALGDPAAWHFKSEQAREWSSRHGSWRGSESRLLGLYSDVLSDYRPVARGFRTFEVPSRTQARKG